MKLYTDFEYLCIDLANHYGLDKEQFETRIAWVKANWNNLESFTKSADEPMLFAKAVNALRNAVKGEAIGHIVTLDACCSGIQVLSAISGCPKGAAATGLLGQERRDAYTLVTEAMQKYVQVEVSRKDAKRSVMTSCYGSKAVPREVFGDGAELDAFYIATTEVAEGAFKLLDVLRTTWKPYALAHAWVLPDGVEVNIKVMDKVEKRLEIQELGGHQMTTQYKVNQGTKSGISNVANITHSLDAYVLRTMVRRCNYNTQHCTAKQHLIEAELILRGIHNTCVLDAEGDLQDHIYLWEQTKMVDTVILANITKANISSVPTLLLQQLNGLLYKMLAHKPFDVVTVHDAFGCLAGNCNQLRFWYKEIMAELAESTVLSFILSVLHGKVLTWTPYDKNLGTQIRNSEYAIC